MLTRPYDINSIGMNYGHVANLFKIVLLKRNWFETNWVYVER